jgi:hypothetical protein
MNETYTFPRALHLMRACGKKMQPIYYENRDYYFSVRKNINNDDILCIHEKDNLYYAVQCRQFEMPSSFEIMGPWVEVK